MVEKLRSCHAQPKGIPQKVRWKQNGGLADGRQVKFRRGSLSPYISPHHLHSYDDTPEGGMRHNLMVDIGCDGG